MVAPPSRRLARTPARLATDPLRGEGAYHRPLPRLSSSETPAADYNLNLSSHKIIGGRRAPSERAFGRAASRLRSQRYRVGRIRVRHICADGLLSQPSPSLGCLKLRPMISVNSSSSTTTSGSNEEISWTVIIRAVMYHLWSRAR